jgi:large subunit ribosomal protein L25
MELARMSDMFEFVAESRTQSGKGEVRRLRRQGSVPAIIYGGHQAPQMILLSHNEVVKHLNHEAVYSHVLNVTVDGKTEQAVLKGVQRHPAKVQVLHLDFLRVDMSEKVKMHVPLHFTNEHSSVGVKKGGIATHSLVDVEITCLPSVLPEYIEVNMANLDVGGTIHLSDLVLPAGVEVVALTHGADHDLPVVSIMPAKGSDSAA